MCTHMNWHSDTHVHVHTYTQSPSFTQAEIALRHVCIHTFMQSTSSWCRSYGCISAVIKVTKIKKKKKSHKDQCCSEVVERRLQPTEIVGLGLEKGGEQEGHGPVWQGKHSEPQQEADALNHMAVQISPVNFTSQFYILPLHMSPTEATWC